MSKFSLFVVALVILVGGFFIGSKVMHNDYAVKEGDRVVVSYKEEQFKKGKDGKDTKEKELVDAATPYTHNVGEDDNFKEFDKLVLGQKVGFKFTYEAKDKKNQVIKDLKKSEFVITKIKKCTASTVGACFK